LRTFRKCDTLRICDVPNLPQVRKYIRFLLTNVAYNAQQKFELLHKKTFKNTTFRTVLRQSCTVFCKNLWICDLRIYDKIGGFAICGLKKKFVCPPLFIYAYTILKIYDIKMNKHTELVLFRVKVLLTLLMSACTMITCNTNPIIRGMV
jgi:hypothetical protein